MSSLCHHHVNITSRHHQFSVIIIKRGEIVLKVWRDIEHHDVTVMWPSCDHHVNIMSLSCHHHHHRHRHRRRSHRHLRRHRHSWRADWGGSVRRGTSQNHLNRPLIEMVSCLRCNLIQFTQCSVNARKDHEGDQWLDLFFPGLAVSRAVGWGRKTVYWNFIRFDIGYHLRRKDWNAKWVWMMMMMILILMLGIEWPTYWIKNMEHYDTKQTEAPRPYLSPVEHLNNCYAEASQQGFQISRQRMRTWLTRINNQLIF